MEQNILFLVTAAQGDISAADDLVRQYLPFIKSETAKYIHRLPMEGQDNELSIAMFVFHEAIMRYSKEKGAFLSFASLQIKSRLIDYFRKEKRHGILGYEKEIYEIPTVKAGRCVDTTGAGDTFVSDFLWAHSNGWEPMECARFACAAASFAVEPVGATGGNSFSGRSAKEI